MRAILLALTLGLAAAPALASETITYSYDANGRLVTVVHAGVNSNPGNQRQTTYQHDKADNRKPNVVATGASQWSWFKWGSTAWSGQ
jgi:hypothetical protein